MKLKLDENGNVVITDGKPVYVHDDGKEIAFDAAGAMQKIHELNAESKSHREKSAGFEKVAKQFEGIDPELALKAIETVKNLDQKKLIEAGDVERMKSEMTKALDEKYRPYVEKSEALERELFAEKVGGSFSRSKMIAEKLAIPSDLVQAKFGGAFKVEDGKVVGYDGNNQIFSRSRPGEIADFDEALEQLIDKYPHRDSILKGSGAVGAGALGGTTGGAGKVMPKTQFSTLSPAAKMDFMKSGGQLTE